MRLLIIEDDQELCEVLQFEFKSEGIDVDICHDGYEGLQYIRQKAHDIILLDRMLPTINGIEILQIMRKEEILTAVICITAMGALTDKIEGLDAGADDYIVKPFAFTELMARIRSISRRPKSWEGSHQIELDGLTYNTDEKVVSYHDISCMLSKKEGDLLELFMRNSNTTLPRTLILSRVWGPYAEVEDGNLDNYIHFLRKRLSHIESGHTITTVRGIGYRMEKKDV
jgi:DNA-binding response OmpR family regulator